ncbi:GNAT family N-acetyltransferase [Evansella cellulosilytica]|nr:GNAT family N-acetyltransferase [Evansella cellulosilytica]
MKDYTIQLATEDKREEISNFVITMLEELYPTGAFNPNPTDLVKFNTIYLNRPIASFYIALNHSRQIVGTAAIRPYDDRFSFLGDLKLVHPVCEMTRFYVEASYRGIGIGKELYALTENYAFATGYKTSYLHTSKYLPGGYHFWKSRGYEENVWEDDQIVHMCKRIYE